MYFEILDQISDKMTHYESVWIVK